MTLDTEDTEMLNASWRVLRWECMLRMAGAESDELEAVTLRFSRISGKRPPLSTLVRILLCYDRRSSVFNQKWQELARPKKREEWQP